LIGRVLVELLKGIGVLQHVRQTLRVHRVGTLASAEAHHASG
jgi:hypothetical protein